uniref:Uncharacterized protein n=1 Tax=Salix viminalis TaxID=40686 RepID=A0A6N2MVR5_SALVM
MHSLARCSGRSYCFRVIIGIINDFSDNLKPLSLHGFSNLLRINTMIPQTPSRNISLLSIEKLHFSFPIEKFCPSSLNQNFLAGNHALAPQQDNFRGSNII